MPADQRTAIDGFYAERAYAPFWTEPGSSRGSDLVAALATGGDQALPVARYDAEALAHGAGDAATEEVALMRAFLLTPAICRQGCSTLPRWSRTSAGTRFAPRRPPCSRRSRPLRSPRFWPASRRPTRTTAGWSQRSVGSKAEARTATWGPAVAAGATLHPGDVEPRVGELRARLARLGYLVPEGEVAGQEFDPTLEQAVRRFQADYGLVDDGVAGAMTLAAVNAPIETRLAQVAVDLERIRWMPRDLGDRYLSVNIPDFTVHLVESGQSVWDLASSSAR